MRNIINHLSNFPESVFNTQKKEYYEKTLIGLEKMESKEVLIVGLVRDSEKALPQNIWRIERLGKMFKSYNVFLYENDSVDKTKDILIKWSQNNNRISTSLNTLEKKRHDQDKSEERRTDMAFYRNKYVEEIHVRGGSYDYVIVYDFDILGGFSYEGVANSIGWDYDITGSNSIIYQDDHIQYYDSYALEMYEDKTQEEKNLLSFSRGDEPVEVKSCFGGMAIYKQECSRSGFNYTADDCDHKTLHKEMRDYGFRVYLNPSQIVLYNETRYLL